MYWGPSCICRVPFASLSVGRLDCRCPKHVQVAGHQSHFYNLWISMDYSLWIWIDHWQWIMWRKMTRLAESWWPNRLLETGTHGWRKCWPVMTIVQLGLRRSCIWNSCEAQQKCFEVAHVAICCRRFEQSQQDVGNVPCGEEAVSFWWTFLPLVAKACFSDFCWIIPHGVVAGLWLSLRLEADDTVRERQEWCGRAHCMQFASLLACLHKWYLISCDNWPEVHSGLALWYLQGWIRDSRLPSCLSLGNHDPDMLQFDLMLCYIPITLGNEPRNCKVRSLWSTSFDPRSTLIHPNSSFVKHAWMSLARMLLDSAKWLLIRYAFKQRPGPADSVDLVSRNRLKSCHAIWVSWCFVPIWSQPNHSGSAPGAGRRNRCTRGWHLPGRGAGSNGSFWGLVQFLLRWIYGARVLKSCVVLQWFEL